MVTAGACFGLTMFFLTYGMALLFMRRRRAVHTRVAELRHAPVSQSVDALGSKKVRRLSSGRWLSRLESLLRRAEIEIPVKEFVVRWVLVVLCVAMLMFLLIGIGGALVAVLCAFFAVALYLRSRGQGRIRRFNDGLHDVLIMISNSLHAGHSFVQSIRLVVQDAHGPIQEEFERLLAEMQMGVGIDEALDRSGERIESDDYDLIITAISIQRQVGGNLAEVLESIAQTIRDRVKLKREVKALTSQGRLSAMIFMFLPLGVGCILFFINPSYLSILFQSPIGIAMLVFAAIGQGVGYLFIRKIIQIDL